MDAVNTGQSTSRVGTRRLYYTGLTAIMLILGLIAFFNPATSNFARPSQSEPRMIVHGVFALAWMVLLVIQANAVRTGNLTVHRRWGPWVFAVGAALVITTAYLFFEGFKGFAAMSPSVLANRIMLPLFALAVFFAWRKRTLAAWHKRLIVLGTLLTLSPILSRAIGGIFEWLLPERGDSPLEPLFVMSFAGVWTGLLASHWIYDWRVLGRIHPVTIGATVALYGVYAFVYLI